MAQSARPKALSHRRPPEPRIFPVEEQVPETRRHFELRTLLFAILRLAFGADATIGSDQFVYWNAAEPRRCLAPDVFLRKGVPDHTFDSWKTWRHGAPELAIEIVSRADAPELAWETKLARYHELGVEELVRFDVDEPPGARIRVFDRVDGDFVERVVEGDATPSIVVPGTWVVAEAEDQPIALRLARADGALYPTPVEAERRARAEEQRARAEEQRARAEEQRARAEEQREAARRIAELEEELRRRGG